MKIQYVTEDGCSFDDKKIAQAHEKLFRTAATLAEKEGYSGMDVNDLRDILMTLANEGNITINI